MESILRPVRRPVRHLSLLAFAALLARGQANALDGPALNNLGVSLRRASRPAEALPKFNDAIKIAEDSGNDRLLAAALAGLGAALVDLGEFARAQPVLRRSLSIFEKTTGSDSLETGAAANNLAMVYRKTGDFVQAQAQLEHALPLMEKYLGPKSRELEIALNNMFDVLAEQQAWDQAEPYVERALEIAKRLPDDALLADIQENMALLLAHQKQFREAARTMHDVIGLEERILEPDDRRLARSLDTYAGYLKKIGQKSEARRVEERAKTIRRAGL